MKEGQIQSQGTFDDIARSNPELYRKWQEDVAASESELSEMSGNDSTIEERGRLQKQVTLLKRGRTDELSPVNKLVSNEGTNLI